MKDTKLWINGQWHDAEESYELASPYSGEVIAHVAKASIQDVEKAIEGARRHSNLLKRQQPTNVPKYYIKSLI